MCTKEELGQIELVPFKTLISDHIATIMTGHMALPNITGDDTPSSLSHQITTDLLRHELHFDGVVVTDCLEMEAVAQKYGSESGAVLALQAGADIVMICHTMSRHQGAIEKTYAAITDGRLSLDELNASGKRIALLKDAFAGTWDDVLYSSVDMDKWLDLKKTNAVLSQQAYASAMTLIQNANNVLPLPDTAKPVVVFTPRMESINPAVDVEGVLRDGEGRVRNTAGPSYHAFAAAIAQRAPMQHIVYGPADELPQLASDYIKSAASVVFATRNGFDRGAWQTKILQQVIEKSGDKTLVIVSTCAPYDVLGLRDVPGAILATMEFTVPALETAVKVIFGEVDAKGRVPVHIP